MTRQAGNTALVQGEPVEPPALRHVLRQAQDERNGLRFAGYAALFGVVDAARDIVSAGAFRRTLAERRDALPLFFQHRPEQRIGWIESAQEDARGLKVVAQIDNPDGKAAHLLASRAISGLSFGYRARRYRSTGSGRMLDDVDLFEVSLVSHPLQHGARVHLLI